MKEKDAKREYAIKRCICAERDQKGCSYNHIDWRQWSRSVIIRVREESCNNNRSELVLC